MITLRELLADPAFKEFMLTKPVMPRYVAPDAHPWRVYLHPEMSGPWRRRDFHTYVEAFKFLKPRLPDVYDAALQSKGIAWQPPAKVVRVMRRDARGRKVPKLDEKGKQVYRRIVWQPTLPAGEEAHVWCTYCRRPTTFRWYRRHHAFPKGYEIATPHQRCTICGSSERLVRNLA